MTIGHVVHGRGPVRAVVIHGWFYDWHVFEPMLPALDPAVFSLAFMDCRGYGSSRAMTGAFDIDTIAADALELASHLGWERFAVVGHSMGGKAALRVAANAPHRVTRILALTPVWAGAAPFDAFERTGCPPHASFWPAKLGRDKLEIKWDDGPNASLSTAGMREQYSKLAQSPGLVAKKIGDPAKALAAAAKTVTAEFEVPYLAHATMEPLNCVVDLRADSCGAA